MNVRELWRKFQLLLIIACGTCPAVLLLLDRLAPSLVARGWLFSAAYLILAFLGIQIKGNVRMASGLGMAAVYLAGVFLVTSAEVRLGAILAAAVCIVLLMWSLKIGGWSRKEEIPVAWVAVGMVCHLLGQVCVYADRISDNPALSESSGVFLAALFGFSLLTMLSMNRRSLSAASGKRQGVPETMYRRNSILTAMLFLLALLISLLPSAFAGFSQAVGRALAWVVQLVTRLIPDAKGESTFVSEEASSNMMAELGAQQQSSGLNPLTEKIAAVVGAILSAAFLLFLLYRLYRMLRSALRGVAASMGKYVSNVSEDYVDEITDTREDGTAEKLERRRGTRLTAREERTLPPEERIRYRYRRILRKHPEWVPGATARETLDHEMARMYERVRYSGEAVTEEEAAAFTAGTSV